MSRWEHTVTVSTDSWHLPYLQCSCGWDHRRDPAASDEPAQDR